MKFHTKKILVTLLLINLLVFMGIINCSAVKINNNNFRDGEKLTYIVQIKTDTRLSGLNGTIEYSVDTLELDKDSINIPELGDMVISNSDEAGVIRFVATNAGEGFDFSNTKLVVTVTFKVKEKAKDADIKFTVVEATDLQLSDITLADNEVIQSIQEGEYNGTIVNPGNGDNFVDDGSYILVDDSDNTTVSEQQATDSKSKTIIFTLIVAVVLIVAASVVVRIKNRNRS